MPSRSAAVPEIFIKVTRLLAALSGLNKYSQHQMFHAARLLLVGGSVTATLLVPSTAVPESRVGTGAPNAALSAAAHLNFKIIVPKVLYLRVGSAYERLLGAQTVAVMSNGHNATLNATLRTLDLNAPARGNLILNAAARKVIAQDAHCTLGPGGAAAARAESKSANAGAPQVVCTLTMP